MQTGKPPSGRQDRRRAQAGEIAGHEAVDRAGRGPGARGVDEHRGVGAVERVEQVRQRPRTAPHDDAVGQRARREQRGDRETRRVVRTRGADADHVDAHGGSRRSTVTVRKCVAHEMHGS